MMPVKSIKNQNGFTLIEIMIALLIGIIVVGGALSIYISTIRGSTDTVNSARLNYDLDAVAQVIVNDIRRAGFWGGAVAGSDAKNNPFVTGAGAIVISNKTGEAANSCILYAYDADADGTYDVDGDGVYDAGDGDDNNEIYGFRLNGDSIDMRLSVANFTNTGCDDGNWESIVNTDKLVITALTFSNANYKCLNVNTATSFDDTDCASVTAANLPSGVTAVETRLVNISLQGNVVGEATVDKSLNAFTKARNDRIFTQP